MLFATSCENDADVAPNAGEAAVVTFSVGTPEIVSRAYSDGQTATVLQYAVYDEDGELLPALTVTNGEIHGSTTVNLKLTTGKEYSVIFWAAAPNAPYTVDFANKTMTVNYEHATCNDEKRDAFYKYHEFTVNGTQTETIELKRPFAQLNIGTSDYAASASADYTPLKSEVTVKQIYTTLNLGTGEVGGKTDVTFACAPINKKETFPVADNEYIAMNYLLVAEDKELVEVVFTHSNESKKKTRTVGSVPVQRNYRTNLYGKLLTSEVDINVEIVEDFDGEFDNEGYFVVETNASGAPTAVVVESAKGMATIANAIADGTIPSNAKIDLKGDIDLADLAEVMRSGAVASNWTPIGTSENPFTGTFDGKGYTIKNLVINGGSKSYIGLFGDTRNGEIKNLTIENAKVSGYLAVGVVAGQPYTSKYTNITVKGHVEVNGFAYVGGVGGRNAYANWENITVDVDETSYVKAHSVTEDGTAYRTYVGGVVGFNGEGGHSFKNIKSNIKVEGSTIDVGGLFGIAHYGNQFENCVCTGDVEIYAAEEEAEAQQIGGIAGVWNNGGQDVVMNNCSFTGTLTANNGFVITPKFTNLVCAAYNANGTGKLIIDGVEYMQTENGVTVNGADYVSNGLYYAKDTKTYVVYNAEGLIALSETTIKGGETITLGADIDLTGKTFNGLNAFNPENNNTFDGKGYTVSNWTYTGKVDDMGFIKNWVGTIKNLTVKNAVLRTGGRSAVIAAKPYGNIENCHVEDCNLQANYWACGLIAGMHNSGNMKNCTAKNSYIKSTGGTGAITGVLNETSGTRTYESCSATGCTINNEGDDPFAGAAIIGLINIDNVTVKLANCTQSNNTYKGTAKDEFIGYNAGDNVTITIE